MKKIGIYAQLVALWIFLIAVGIAALSLVESLIQSLFSGFLGGVLLFVAHAGVLYGYSYLVWKYRKPLFARLKDKLGK